MRLGEEQGDAEETARAVASLDKLIRWSFPLLTPGGRLLALKGGSAQEELDGVAPLLRRAKHSGLSDGQIAALRESREIMLRVTGET